MKKLIPLVSVLALWLPGAQAQAQAPADIDEMYKTKNCFACHRIDRNHLAPNFKNIAAKYADDKGADEKLAKKIREGSVGVWGPVPMPAQAQVTEAEALMLSRWILERK